MSTSSFLSSLWESIWLQQGGIDLAVLEKYELASSTGRGDPFSLVWELKDVHGKEAGKGLRAASNIRGRSIALSYTSKSDLQLLSHSGSHLASVNSSGSLRTPLISSHISPVYGTYPANPLPSGCT